MSSLGDLISKVKPGGVSTPTKSLSDVITQAKSPSVNSPTPPKDPFFYKQFPNGSTVGKSDELDTSGVPLLGYRNPGDTATTTDKTRVATKFDPSTPQKLDPKTFLTPRAVKARATLKQTLGGGHSDELDHKISLELAGSNQPENLQVEPLVPGTTNTATDPLENSLAKDVANGKISLFDAHVQLAKAKKIPPPFTAGTVKSDPNWIEKAWDSFKGMIVPTQAESLGEKTKKEVLKQPFTPFARHSIEDIKVNTIPKGKTSAGLQEGGTIEGQFNPAGKDLHNFIVGTVGQVSPKASEFILNHTNFLQSLNKANIDITNSDPQVLSHEIMHLLFESSPMGVRSGDLSDNPNAEKFGKNFLTTWDNLAEKDSDAPMQMINKRISSDYETKDMAGVDLATERFAYLGELVSKYGTDVIPKELRPYYKSVFDFSKAGDKPVDKSTPVAGTTDPYANIGKGEVTSTTAHAKSLDVRDPKGVFMGTFTGDKAYEQAQKKADEIGGTVEESNQFGTAGRLASKAAESAVQIIKGVSNSTADFLESASDPKATPQDRALKLGKIAVSGLWGIFAAEYPVFTLATSIGGELPPGPTSKDGKELPSLRTAILGINKLFEKGVEGSQKEAELNINAIPDSVMSRETKDKVIPLVGDLVTVLNMFAAGSLAHTVALPETQQKLGEIKDAVWNEAKNIKNLPNKQGGFISAPGTPEESRTPDDSIRTGEPVHPDGGNENLAKKIEEYKGLPTGEHIDNPTARIPVGDTFNITNQSLKHFVESRMAQGADVKKAISHLQDTVDNPTFEAPNKPEYPNTRRLIKILPEGKKALTVVVDKNNEIVTIHYARFNNLEAFKSKMLASGGSPYPHRSLPVTEDLAVRRISALQKPTLDSKPAINSSISPVAEKSTSYPQALIEEAKKYKTADEFIKALDEGKAGLHVDYAPIKRFLESNTGSFNLEKVGFKPDEMITVYRGIDDLSGKVERKINPGDYVATTRELAQSYTGNPDDVVEMQIKAKDFYLDEDPYMKDDFSGEFTPERLSQVSLEGVYNPQKPISNSELVDLFNKVNGKEKFKLSTFDTFKAKLANGEFNTPEAHALAEVSKLFGPHELTFLFRDDLIEAFEGKTALGKYTSGNAFKNPMIEMVRVGGKVQDRTLYHESFHAYLDNFVDPTEKAQLLYKVNKNILTSLAQKLPSDYPKGLVRAEEWLADDFADWMKTNKSKAGGEYIPFYKRILNAIRGFIRKITGAQSLYDRIINRDRSYKKPTTPRTLDYARFKLKPDEGDAEIKINQLMSRIALVDNPRDIENILRNEVGYPESEIPGMVEKLVDVKNPDTIRRILEGEEDISPSEKKKKLLEYIPEEIFMRGSELELRKEALDEDPARFLSKYARNGKLPEVLGSGIGHGIFKTRGDDIVTEHGFKDSEEARDAFDKYLSRKTKWKTDKALYERDLRNFTEEAKRKLRQVTKLKNIEIQREEAAKKGVKNFADNKTPLDEMHVGTILKNEYGEKISANPSLKDKTRTIKDFIPFYKKFTLSDQVGLHDYFSTPKYVLEKMKLGRFASDLRNAQDAYLNELPKHIETIQEWRNMVPGKDENHKLFKYLDGQPAANFLESVYNKGPMFDKNGVTLSWDDILNPMEKQVAGEIKQWYADFASRLNLPEDQRITWYITHLFDFHAGEGPEFDPDMAAIMRNKIPGSVYDPFLIQRLGKYGYIENTWLALEAYAKRGTRKANLDPILDQVGHLVKGTDLEDSQWKFLKQHLDGVNMRPTGDEQLANTMIKQLFGYRFGPRPYLSLTGKAQRVLYRALLGLNMKNALKNLTQGINTYAILGEKHTMIGYAKLVSKQFDSEEIGEMLNSSTNVTTEKPTAGRRVTSAADKVLFSLHNATEFINRTSAYLGAKSKGKEVLLTSIDKAKSEKVGDLIPIVKDSRMIRTLTNYRRKWGNRVLGVDDVSEIVKMYAKEVVADTQFRYDNVDLPPVLKYPTVKLFAPFSSFAVKETEFIVREAFGKNGWGLVRFGLATALMIYLVGKDLNISWGDYIPVYSIFQNRFSSTPATLNLPTTIFGSLTNSAGLFGKGQTAKARLDAVFNAIVLSLPAGLAGQRAYQGVQKLNALGVENQVPKTLGNMTKAVILGKTSLQTRKDEMTKTAGKISDLMKQGKKTEAETLFKSLPDVDKKEVIKIEKSKKAAQKSALTKEVKPLILKAKELIQQGNKEEAKALFQKLSPEEKQRFQKLYNTTK